MEPPHRSEVLYTRKKLEPVSNGESQDVNKLTGATQKRKGQVSDAATQPKLQKSSDLPKSALNLQAPPFFVKQVYK